MNIKDCLHLYLGCEINYHLYSDGEGYMANLTGTMIDNWESYNQFKPAKLILRPLSDMTEEEGKEVCRYTRDAQAFVKFNTAIGKEAINATTMVYLLSKHFDLFGLIDAGLAIDKTKIKP